MPQLKSKGVTSKVWDIKGASLGSVALSGEIFGQKPNDKLLAQAIRVGINNDKGHFGSTKTRAEVRGGGAKPWRQKGTGNARAGSRRSPLWVGGGQIFGPKHRNAKLILPKKMRRKALLLALSAKFKSGNVKVISNLEKIEAKTKLVASLFNKLAIKGSTIVVVSRDSEDGIKNIKLAGRNIPQVSITDPANLNAYQIISHQNVVFSREAISKFK